jgi:hypothetical protein
MFTYLKDYLTDDVFDKAMQSYYAKWEFKHPQPGDMRKALEESTGKDLTWFFEDILETTKQIDYKIASVKKNEKGFIVKVNNVGQIDCPVRVDGFKYGKLIETKWVEPGGDGVVSFNGTAFDQFVIDEAKMMPDMNRNNNYWSSKGMFKRTEHFKMEFLGGDNEAENWNSWYLPIMGGNKYDKFMIGMMFHNISLPKNKFEYTIAPMFTFGRKTIAGFADFNYSWVPAKNFKMISAGVTTKTFGNGLGTPVDSVTSARGEYYVVQPYLDFNIGKPKAKKYYKQKLKLQGAYAVENANMFNSTTYGGFAQYTITAKKRIHQFRSDLRFDYYNYESELGISSSAGDVLNASLTLDYKIMYWKRKKSQIELRTFFGQNLFYNVASGVKDARYGMSLGGQSGTQDVLYEHWMMGRNETSGIYGGQRIENQGGFKTVSGYGTSNDMIFATNFIVDIPYTPLVIFADYGMFDNAGTMQSVYDMGIGFRFGDTFGIYYPLLESVELKNATGLKDLQKIRFTINMNGLKPKDLIQSQL